MFLKEIMMKTLKRILSMMIIVGLIFSFPAASLAENADHAGYEEADSAGNRLAVREIDPRSLKVPRLGNKPGGSPEPAQEEALYGPDEMVRVSILLEKPSVLDAGFSLQKIAAGPEGRKYRDELIAGQERIAEQISDTVPGVGKLDIKWHLTLAENMISANIPYGAVSCSVRRTVVDQHYLIVVANENGLHDLFDLLDDASDRMGGIITRYHKTDLFSFCFTVHSSYSTLTASMIFLAWART